MTNMTELPPKYQLVGDHAGNFGAEAEINQVMDGFSESLSFSTEIPHTAERLAQLGGLNDAVLGFGKDLGFDLTDRLFGPDRYHFFRNVDDLKKAMTEVGEDPHDQQNGWSSTKGIFIVEGADDLDTMSTAAHETMHRIAQAKLKLKQSEGDVDGFDVVAPTSKVHFGLMEMSADIMSLHLQKSTHWSDQPSLPKNDRTIMLYCSLDIIGDELIKTLASEVGVKPIEVLREVEAMVVSGNMSGLLKLGRAMKPQSFRALLNASHTQARKEYIVLAETLGLPDAAKKIQAIGLGVIPDVLDWLV
jgi:hypothetical protein